MLNTKLPSIMLYRNYKNFGHKREPVPIVTTLWHGFLTFTFMGLCLNWEKIKSWVGLDELGLDKKND